MSINRLVVEIVGEDGALRKTLRVLEDDTRSTGTRMADAISGAFDSGLGKTVKTIGLWTVAAVAAFKTVEFAANQAMAGEKVDAVSHKFDVLSERAGLMGASMFQAFDKASGGLVGTTEILEAANRGIVEMGSNADKLPEIFDLARKATSIFGGDVVQNFDAMSHAIATGNARSLKNVGIIIDQDAALKKYAETLGVTVDLLSESGRKQAIANAAIEQGHKALDGLGPSTKIATDALTRMKVSFSDAIEEVQRLLADKLGPGFAALFNAAANALDGIANKMASTFGHGKEKILADIEIAQGRVEELTQKIKNIQENTGNASSPMITKIQKQLQNAIEEVAIFKGELLLLDMPGAGKKDNDVKEDEFAKHLSNLRTEATRHQMALLDQKARFNLTEDEQDRLSEERKRLMKDMKDGEIADLESRHQGARLQKTDEFFRARQAIIDKWAEKEQEETQKKHKWADDAAKSINSSLKNGLQTALAAMGAALVNGQAGWKEFGKAVIGIIGDLMIQVGMSILLQGKAITALKASLLTMDGGLAIAAGAALVIAGGAMKALAGGSGGGTSTADTGGGVPASTAVSDSADIQEKEERKSNVVINVHGNILDRRQSGLEIFEVMKEHFENSGGKWATA